MKEDKKTVAIVHAPAPPVGSKSYFVARHKGSYQAWDVWEVSYDGSTWKHRLAHEGELHADAVRIEQRLRIQKRVDDIEREGA